MISNYNESTHQWEKITFEQWLDNAAKDDLPVMLEVSRDSWKELKPKLVKRGFLHPDTSINWGNKSSCVMTFPRVSS